MTSAFVVDTVGGISGSLTNLVDGTSYLIAGDNISIITQSNGSVIISNEPDMSSGLGIFGDGSDGVGLITSDTSLTKDMFYTTLTIDSGKTLFTNGSRVFVNGKCIISGAIDCSGKDAINGTSSGGVAGLGGTDGGLGSSTHSLQQSQGVSFGIPGVDAHGGGGNMGGDWGVYNTDNGCSIVRSLPFAIAGAGITSSGIKKIPGGTGGGGSANSTGGGGGGGVLIIVASQLEIVVSGSISVRGGNGAGDIPGGSGGGGGGTIILVTKDEITNNGDINVSGGLGGTGFGGNPGGNANSGLLIKLRS